MDVRDWYNPGPTNAGYLTARSAASWLDGSGSSRRAVTKRERGNSGVNNRVNIYFSVHTLTELILGFRCLSSIDVVT